MTLYECRFDYSTSDPIFKKWTIIGQSYKHTVVIKLQPRMTYYKYINGNGLPRAKSIINKTSNHTLN